MFGFCLHCCLCCLSVCLSVHAEFGLESELESISAVFGLEMKGLGLAVLDLVLGPWSAH